MPVITPRKTLPSYDVIVVGTGAAGGMSAYVLCKAGVKVLMLEAGRNYDPIDGDADVPDECGCAAARDGDAGQAVRLLRRHGRRRLDGAGRAVLVKREAGTKWDEASDWKAKETKQNFMWWRPRMLGGRTNHWGRISLRMGPYDFKPKTRDGLGLDWPFDYKDLAPWYDKTEVLVGVYRRQRRAGEHAGFADRRAAAAAEAARATSCSSRSTRASSASR